MTNRTARRALRSAWIMIPAFSVTTALLTVPAAGSAQPAARPATSLVDPATPSDAEPAARSAAQTLVFSDEFNSTTLNSAKWTARNWPRSGAVPPDTWSYDPANVSINTTGQLEIKVRKTGATSYTGGLIDSAGKFDYTYGRLEARVRFPPTNGHLGAVWLLPSAGLAPGGRYDGTARDGAEMDLAESNYRADRYTVSLHWDSFNPPQHQQSSTVANAPGMHSGYHTIGLDWTPTSLQFTYDGTVVRTITDPRLISQVKEYPLLSHEVLDQWTDGSIREEIFDSRSSFWVDHIRIWK
ncbi:glycoside hydrolase family 16 protein [Streptomyces sp. NPDC004610]|uniref:glycoside hydrolase family 16 protein n=1 Tax=unclassified Streptomyces TaxID=2593676 RepID=UPI0033BF8384